MSLLLDNDFHHRIDLFEPGDKTALVCVDVPEVQRIAVENLSELEYKIHTGLFVEDILRSVAMVYIPVHDQDSLQPELFNRCSGGDGGISQKTEAHRGIGKSVMPRGSDEA